MAIEVGTQPGSGASRTLVTEGAAYMAVEAAQQAVALAVLPVFFFFLTTEDFGVITLSLVLTQFGLAMGTLGLDFSLMRFYFRWTEGERARRATTITLVTGAWSLVLAIGPPFFFGAWFDFGERYWVLAVGWWAGLTLAVRGVPLSLVRVRGALKDYSVFVLGGAVLQAVVQATCVIAGWGARGYMLGYAAGAAVSAALAFAGVRGQLSWSHVTWRVPREIVAYTASVLPSVLFLRFISVADRLVLARWVSTDTLGIYGAASRFTTPVKLLSGGFKMALAPVLSREESSNTFETTFAQLGRIIVVGMLLLGSGILTGVWFLRFTPWGGKAAAQVQQLVALLLVAQFLSAFSYLGQLRLYYSSCAWAVSLAAGVNAVALVTGLIAFVPAHGAIGAAAAEVIAVSLAIVVLMTTILRVLGGARLWGRVSAPLLTFVPALTAVWFAGRAEQLVVFLVTLAAYASTLLFYARRANFARALSVR